MISDLKMKIRLPDKVRGFVVTNWNLDTCYQKLIDAGDFQFIAYGLETCPTTKKKHHQAFCYTKNPRSTKKMNLCKMGKLFGEVQCHVEPMYGNFGQNEEYCSKESDLSKFGVEPVQGARGDLIEIKTMVMEDKLTADELALMDPYTFHMYGRTVERIQTIRLRQRFRTEMTAGIWITGPSSAGKSHMAFEGYSPDTHFLKNLEDKWWDGYNGQETVIFNEFRGQVSFNELLTLVDKWPHTVPQRGKEPVPFLAKKLIVTSVKEPQEIYWRQDGDEPWEQFERRFEIVRLAKRKREDEASDPEAPGTEVLRG